MWVEYQNNHHHATVPHTNKHINKIHLIIWIPFTLFHHYIIISVEKTSLNVYRDDDKETRKVKQKKRRTNGFIVFPFDFTALTMFLIRKEGKTRIDHSHIHPQCQHIILVGKTFFCRVRDVNGKRI